MKFYSKTKRTTKLGYRTPDFYKGKTFGVSKNLNLKQQTSYTKRNYGV